MIMTVEYHVIGVVRIIYSCVMGNYFIVLFLLFANKDVRELSWMSHGVIHFWFLLNFVFILAFFDILASLSISSVFSSGIWNAENPPGQIFPEQLSNLII